MAKFFDLAKNDGSLLEGNGDLYYEFGCPPFSVIDTKTLDWKFRKQTWLSKGINGGLGRNNRLIYTQENIDQSSETFASRKREAATSLFDPVLCELLYRWFCPKDGVIIDPFAGGITRGAVASLLNYRYFGVDLSEKQIKENIRQAAPMCKPLRAQWILGDSYKLLKLLKQNHCAESDMVISCPPYFDLEQYSDDPSDLSNMTWGDFLHSYSKIIGQCCQHLKNNRFACFVLNDVRNSKTGCYYGLIHKTIQAFEDNGLPLYNHAILLNPTGLAAMKAKRTFNGGRKLIGCHQHVLVFLKGDWKKATQACKG